MIPRKRIRLAAYQLHGFATSIADTVTVPASITDVVKTHSHEPLDIDTIRAQAYLRRSQQGPTLGVRNDHRSCP